MTWFKSHVFVQHMLQAMEYVKQALTWGPVKDTSSRSQILSKRLQGQRGLWNIVNSVIKTSLSGCRHLSLWRSDAVSDRL